jgi:outer membrane protein assembly factor BamB
MIPEKSPVSPLRAFFCVAVILALVGFNAHPCRAQAPELSPAWDRQLPQPIEWYVRTSEGVLIVRAGETLSAIDGVDGRLLWTLPYIEIGGAYGPKKEMLSKMTGDSTRGRNLLEVPGLSILLINRAKLSKQDDPGHLLGVDLWSGKILWQQPELDELCQLIPFYERGRVLLVTAKIFRPQLTLLDPLTGHVDWTAEYPRLLNDWFLDFRELGGQVYLYEPPFILGRIDMDNGKRLWEFTRDYRLFPYQVPDLEFAHGRVILAVKDVFAFDPASKTPVWTAPHMGVIRGIVVDQDLILGAGDNGAFALDSGTGALRWKIKTSGHATNLVLDEKDSAVAFCDNNNLVLVDVATGKVLRRTPHRLGSDPDFIVPIGKNFILVLGDNLAALLEISSGERLDSFPRPERAFPAFSFLVDQRVLVGDASPPSDLARQLRNSWPKISAEESQNQAASAGLARLESFLTGDSAVIYGNKSPDGGWEFRRIDAVTGDMQQFDVKEGQPDPGSSLGLVYTVTGDHLRAAHIPTN